MLRALRNHRLVTVWAQAFAAPSASYCKIHGAPAHSCYLYSVSDDRSLKVFIPAHFLMSNIQCHPVMVLFIPDLGSIHVCGE